MNIQLKEGKTFTHPKTDSVFTQLFGGMKNLNVSIQDWTLNFNIKLYVSQEKMGQGKGPVFEKTFSVNNYDEHGELDLMDGEFTQMLMSAPDGETIKDVIEKALYTYVLTDPEFIDFEIV